MSPSLPATLQDAPDRKEAITTDCHAFVSASAGTGKTHTLILRALYLLLNAPFLPADDNEPAGGSLYNSSSRPERLAIARNIIHSVVLTTFTRKAAAEMQTRLYGYLNDIAVSQDLSDLEEAVKEIVGIVLENLAGTKESDVGDAFVRLRVGAQALAELAVELQISTIHSFAASMLRRHPLQAGIPPNAHFVKEDESDLSGIDDQVVGRWWEQHELGRSGNRKDLETLLEVVTGPQIRDWLKKCYRFRWILGETEALPLEDSNEEQRLVAAGYALVHELEKKDGSRLTPTRNQFKQILDDIGTKQPGVWGDLCQFILKNKGYLFSDRSSTKVISEALGSLSDKHSWYFRSWLHLYTPASRLCIAKEFQSVWGSWIRLVRRFMKWLNEEAIQELGLITFDDMIRLAVRLLKDQPSVRRAEQRRLRALLVDEFQDTDPQQLELFKVLLQKDVQSTHQVLGFFVGDTKQSIYGFRGVDITAIEDFQKRYEDDVGVKPKKFQLQTSFRSEKKVINFINYFFDKALKLTEEEAQKLIPGPKATSGHLPKWCWIYQKESEKEDSRSGPERKISVARARDLEASETYRIIEKYLKEKASHRYKDILVLVKDGKALDALLPQLQKAGIPVVSSGAKTFHRHPEVLDVLNLLITLLHPQDRLAVAALLRSPLLCLPDPQIHALLKEIPPEKLLHSQQTLPEHLPGPVQTRLNLLRKIVLQRTSCSLSEWLAQIRILVPEALYSQASDQEGRSRARIDRVFDAFKEESQRLAVPPLVWLLGQRDRAAEIDRWNGSPGEDVTLSDESINAVRVMTIHKAKGLEGRFVIIYGWTSVLLGLGGKSPEIQEVIGGAMEKADLLKGYSMKWGPLRVVSSGYRETLAHERQSIENEAKRLAYVATTRARDGLVLLSPPSAEKPPFSKEIEDLLQSANETIPIQAKRRDGVTIFDGHLRFTRVPGLEVKPTPRSSISFEVNEEEYKVLWTTRYAQTKSTFPSVLRSPSDSEHQKEEETLEDHHYRGITDPKPTLWVGRLVHSYLEQYLLDDGLDKEKLSGLSSKTPEEIPNDDTIDLAAKILSDFFSGALTDHSGIAYCERVRQGTILAREFPVYLVHGDENWNGVIDLVLEEGGIIRAVDYKAAVAKDPLPEAYQQQEKIYTEALRRAFPEQQIGFEFWWLRRTDG